MVAYPLGAIATRRAVSPPNWRPCKLSRSIRGFFEQGSGLGKTLMPLPPAYLLQIIHFRHLGQG
jgi:hypothetical protein